MVKAINLQSILDKKNRVKATKAAKESLKLNRDLLKDAFKAAEKADKEIRRLKREEKQAEKAKRLEKFNALSEEEKAKRLKWNENISKGKRRSFQLKKERMEVLSKQITEEFEPHMNIEIKMEELKEEDIVECAELEPPMNIEIKMEELKEEDIVECAELEPKPVNTKKIYVATEGNVEILSKIVFRGTKYLMSNKTNIVYDYELFLSEGIEHSLGKWSEEENKVVFDRYRYEEAFVV
jgi:hypothetical protein